MRTPMQLQLVVACHESLSRSEADLDHVWSEEYAPFLAKLGERRLHAAVHITGHLLDHLARHRESSLIELKRLIQQRRIEVLGGLFYGGIPSMLPEIDVRGQVQMMSEYWESLLGTAPQGFWLPELSWSTEVPRLLADTGLSYGFALSSQLSLRPEPTRSLVVVERGERSLPAFVVDSELSAALANGELTGWHTRVESLAQMQGNLVTVWLSAARLLEADKADPGVVTRFFDGFSALTTVLPSDSFRDAPPASPVRLSPGPMPELWPTDLRPEPYELAFRSAAVDNLTRRMLRTSSKLADAIATMEEEEKEENWSDVLATAQRLVFAAQARDPYVHGPDVDGDTLRQAAMARLIRAEALIDTLVQGEGDWLATEECDADADLRDEVFVCSRHLTVWVVPADGGRVRALDDRIGTVSLIDPSDDALGHAHGIGDLILDSATAASATLSDKARTLLPNPAPWKIVDSGMNDADDCAYTLSLSLNTPIDDDTSIAIEKQVRIAIDAPELCLRYRVSCERKPAALLATEIPLRLPSTVNAFLANGDPLDPGALELSDVDSLRFETNAGALEVTFEPAAEVWCKIHNDRVLVVPIQSIDGPVERSIRIVWQTAANDTTANEADHSGKS